MAENVIEEKRFLQLEETGMETWLYRPEGRGPWPAIIMFMDAQSLRPELQRIAGAIAQRGYVVAVFDLYHRFGYFRPHLRSQDKTIRWLPRS